MVTNLILGVVGNFVAWLLGLIPPITLPDWVATVTTFVAGVVTNALAIGNWIPWDMVGLAFAFVFASWAIAFGIRIARIVASFLTVGGGSAA